MVLAIVRVFFGCVRVLRIVIYAFYCFVCFFFFCFFGRGRVLRIVIYAWDQPTMKQVEDWSNPTATHALGQKAQKEENGEN